MSTVFRSRPLPGRIATELRARLERAHCEDPFSPVEPRAVIRRVTGIVEDLGMDSGMYRGGLDLRGSEVDHVWLAVADPDGDESPFVLDVAFPLFARPFVTALRRFVAGDADLSELAAAAGEAGVAERVLGEFPPPLRYLGHPVWLPQRVSGPRPG